MRWSLFFIKISTLLKRDSKTVFFPWILKNFYEHLFYRTTPSDLFMNKNLCCLLTRIWLNSVFHWRVHAFVCILILYWRYFRAASLLKIVKPRYHVEIFCILIQFYPANKFYILRIKHILLNIFSKWKHFNLPATDENVGNLLLILVIHVSRHKLKFSLASFILFFKQLELCASHHPCKLLSPPNFISPSYPKVTLFFLRIKTGADPGCRKKGALAILVAKQMGILGALCKPSKRGLGPLPVQ